MNPDFESGYSWIVFHLEVLVRKLTYLEAVNDFVSRVVQV